MPFDAFHPSNQAKGTTAMANYIYTNGTLVKLENQSLADSGNQVQDTLSLLCNKEPVISNDISDIAKTVRDWEGHRALVDVLVVDQDGIRIYPISHVQKAGRGEIFLQVCGNVYKKSSKRSAIYRLVRILVEEKGENIEDVAKHFDMALDRSLIYADGIIAERGEFIVLAKEQRKAEERPKFDESRFFCKRDELIHCSVQGKQRTYAIYSNWRGDEVKRALTNLQEAYPQYCIYFGQTE